MNIRIYLYQKNDTNITNMIRTNDRIGKYSNIFEYPNIRHTLSQTTTTTRAPLALGNGLCTLTN